MIRKDVEKWINKMRDEGHTDAYVREQLKKNGWTKAQIDAALVSDRAEEVQNISRMVSGGKDAASTSKKMWIGIAIVVGVVVTGGLVFAGMHYGFPWDANANSSTNATNTVINGYVSNTNTYTGSGSAAVSFTDQLALQSTMGKFEDYDQVRSFLDDHETSSSYGYGGFAMTRSFTDDIMVSEESSAPMGLGEADLDSSAFKSDDYSTTNIQVEGVDEADIVKSDGKYVYAVSKNNVFIIDGRPAADSKILSTIEFKSTPQDIYIQGDSLIIYGQEEQISSKTYYDLIRPYSSYTFFKVFDITDKTDPQQVRDLEFEGSYTNSRMIGDYVYFITSHPTTYIDDDMPIPFIMEDEEVLPIIAGKANCNCPNIYYIDAPYQSYAYTSVTAINITDNNEAITNDAYLLGSSENIFVSQDNIYLVYTKYVSEFQLMYEATRSLIRAKLNEKDRRRMDEIESVPNYILSPEEKLSKVNYLYEKYVDSLTDEEQEKLQDELEQKMRQTYDDISKELEKTVIHKIAIDRGSLTYKGSGEVTGHVLNQFSMDEHEGYFRIATTKGRAWFSTFGFTEDTMESYSNLYVLDADLKQVGAVEGLAEGERIYSVRFMQGRAYLVTFRQMDPLFVVDLADPEKPTVLGELKVPGFSSYLHPYDDTFLIGFGKQATEEGLVQGLKLSLFDVSDVDNLKEVDTYEMGDRGSESIALDDHKAFLFSKDKNLLVIPVTLAEKETESSYRNLYTHGAMVFSVDENGFTFRKQIDHSDGSDSDSNSDYYYGYYYYDTTIKRSLYIDNVLYTLSNKYLKMNGLEDLEEVKSLQLTPGESSDDFTVIR